MCNITFSQELWALIITFSKYHFDRQDPEFLRAIEDCKMEYPLWQSTSLDKSNRFEVRRFVERTSELPLKFPLEVIMAYPEQRFKFYQEILYWINRGPNHLRKDHSIAWVHIMQEEIPEVVVVGEELVGDDNDDEDSEWEGEVLQEHLGPEGIEEYTKMALNEGHTDNEHHWYDLRPEDLNRSNSHHEEGSVTHEEEVEEYIMTVSRGKAMNTPEPVGNYRSPRVESTVDLSDEESLFEDEGISQEDELEVDRNPAKRAATSIAPELATLDDFPHLEKPEGPSDEGYSLEVGESSQEEEEEEEDEYVVPAKRRKTKTGPKPATPNSTAHNHSSTAHEDASASHDHSSPTTGPPPRAIRIQTSRGGAWALPAPSPTAGIPSRAELSKAELRERMKFPRCTRCIAAGKWCDRLIGTNSKCNQCLVARDPNVVCEAEKIKASKCHPGAIHGRDKSGEPKRENTTTKGKKRKA
ncbi:uncharacterized protein LY89DRAFT_741786 [Mollisia scopiformis]|uniref:Uncharacterized protein n=1 Tax=Mollisia scopiformis TaxID=149040 RepID=A0A132B7N4_MOLSC|nr:uncharacterized protein LY89DRAFT_741786 [Mollisia scopiformis]KUJ08416.1 hypothetical protein LY89DRAFT_741786 [Mollisia scopiformis]